MRWLQRLLGRTRPTQPGEVEPAENPYAAVLASASPGELEERRRTEYQRLGLEALARETIFTTPAGRFSLYEGATSGQCWDERLAKLIEKVGRAYVSPLTDPELRRQIQEVHALTSRYRTYKISEVCGELFRNGRTASLYLPELVTHQEDFEHIEIKDGGHWEPVWPQKIIGWEEVEVPWSGTRREPIYKEMYCTDYTQVGMRWKPWSGLLLQAIAQEEKKRAEKALTAAQKLAAARQRERELLALDPEVRALLEKRDQTPRPSH